MDSFSSIAALNFKNHTSKVNLAENDYNVIRPGVLYPGVWGWDSAFHAIGLAHSVGLSRALEELTVSTLGQAPNGMIPHILFYDEVMAQEQYYPAPNIWQNYSRCGLPISGISQPPVFGFALEHVITMAKMNGAVDNLQDNFETIQELFNAAFEYHAWWYNERDPSGTGLVVSVNPWETGRDNACEWIPILDQVRETPTYKNFSFDPSVRKDIRINRKGQCTAAYRPKDDDYKMFTYLVDVLKDNNYSLKDHNGEYRDDWPFMVGDVTINSFLQASNYSLLSLVDVYGSPFQKERLEQWATLTKSSFHLLWNGNDGAYQSYDFVAQSLTEISSNASFLPLLTEKISENNVLILKKTIEKWRDKYDLKYMISSSLPCHSDYDPQCYWRGPVWTIMNAMTCLGFQKCADRFNNVDIQSVARDIAQETLDLICDDGEFYEYHNPITGEGCGAPDFGFTSVAYFICKDILDGN